MLTARKRTKNVVVKAPTELWLVWIITIRDDCAGHWAQFIVIEMVGWTSNWFEHFYMTRLFPIVLQNIWQYLQYFSRQGLFRESFICCRCQLLRIPNTLWTKTRVFYFLAVSSLKIERRKTSPLFLCKNYTRSIYFVLDQKWENRPLEVSVVLKGKNECIKWHMSVSKA